MFVRVFSARLQSGRAFQIACQTVVGGPMATICVPAGSASVVPAGRSCSFGLGVATHSRRCVSSGDDQRTMRAGRPHLETRGRVQVRAACSSGAHCAECPPCSLWKTLCIRVCMQCAMCIVHRLSPMCSLSNGHPSMCTPHCALPLNCGRAAN